MQVIVIDAEEFLGMNVTADDEILILVRQQTMTLHHGAAMKAVGKAGNPTAIVDSNCRISSVQGLRVADASSFPLLPPGHPRVIV